MVLVSVQTNPADHVGWRLVSLIRPTRLFDLGATPDYLLIFRCILHDGWRAIALIRPTRLSDLPAPGHLILYPGYSPSFQPEVIG